MNSRGDEDVTFVATNKINENEKSVRRVTFGSKTLKRPYSALNETTVEETKMAKVDLDDLFAQLKSMRANDDTNGETPQPIQQSSRTNQVNRPPLRRNSNKQSNVNNGINDAVIGNGPRKNNENIGRRITNHSQGTSRNISYSDQPSDLRALLSNRGQKSLNKDNENIGRRITNHSQGTSRNISYSDQPSDLRALLSNRGQTSLNKDVANVQGRMQKQPREAKREISNSPNQASTLLDLRRSLSASRPTSIVKNDDGMTENSYQKKGTNVIKESPQVKLDSPRKSDNPRGRSRAPRGRNQSRSLTRSNLGGSSCSLSNDFNFQMNLDEGSSNVRGDRKARGPPPTYARFGFRRLNEMAKSSDSDEIIAYICQNIDVFENFLKEKPRIDLLQLVLKLVAKATETRFRESKVELYSALCESVFVDHLNSQITLFLTERDVKKFDSINEIFKNLNCFFEDIIKLLPNKAVESLDHLLSVVVVVLGSLSGRSDKFTESANLANKLKNDLDIAREERWAKANEDQDNTNGKSNEKPPNDFRELSLYPTPNDLKERNFLRPNIVKGSYDDVYHYLDVQFRLLREDFIAPLRIGIEHYRESLISVEARKKRNFNIRIYKNVTFLGMHYDPKKPGDISLVVQLDRKYASKIRWEYSKRLLFGSLLLFTKNNFETFQLATVSDRNIKKLADGMFHIVFVGEKIFDSEIFQEEFFMAESSAFFEPVFQTLNAIREFPTDKLPMQRYLLVQDISQKPPQYLADHLSLNIENKCIHWNDESSWPPGESLGFNESQYSALKATLRNEFVVIQGPPGTGKTYLGLKIVKTLLKNIEFGVPILMVCYTNHALDQFLEGLLGVTDEIIRIGGQSKNEALNKFNYQVVRRRCRNFRHPYMEPLRDAMTVSLQKIASGNKLLEDLKTCSGILDLLKYFHDAKLKGMSIFENNLDFMQWLLGDLFGALTYIMQLYSPKYDNLEKVNQLVDLQEEDMEFIDEEELYRRRYFDAFNDVEDLEMLAEVKGEVSYALNLDKLDSIIESMQQFIYKLNSDRASAEEIQAVAYDLSLVQQSRNALYERLKCSDCKPSKRFKDLLRENLWNLSEDDRWAIYHYWIRDIKNIMSKEIIEEQEKYSAALNRWKEVKLIEDYSTLKEINPKILGLTTTGAARHNSLLSVLKPAVIIVEEAAEVLEAHVLVSLTQSCQHLILIGDHKQLKPNPSTYLLAKDFNLDISLFERMLRNGVGCHMLDVQHRMKPNIASLISPTIYEDLKNHPSVDQFPPVAGVMKNLFFINHNFLEVMDADLESKKNPHEAEFLIAFCRHLILQGYDSSDITILTTYSSQQFYLRDLKKQYGLLRDVRITVVDNYQGEECKIILLSLVRNNEEGKIGFLGTENRICVALSRAKHGLYIIGNMEILKSHSELWEKINSTLISQNAIGDRLSLVCQVHNEVTEVKCAKDFQSVMEGGCSLMCRRLMPCSHTCTSLCHVINVDHIGIKCTQPCIREICDVPGHSCPLRCFELCGPCRIKMKRSLPNCDHEALIECHINPSDYKCKVEVNDVKPDCKHEVTRYCYQDVMNSICTTKCDIRLDCGHSCAKKCHVQKDPDHIEYQCMKDCTKKNVLCKNNHMCQKRCWEECGKCTVQVKQKLECGHTHTIACSSDFSDFKCTRNCSKTLPCSHPCKKLCHETCGGCKVMVDKVIPECGHKIKVECQKTVNRSMCKRGCTRKLPCGHACKLKCSQDCSLNECNEYVPSPVQPACGHPGSVLCYRASSFVDGTSDELLRYCREPCNQELPCKDMCKGTCGNCMQGRIHQVCDEKCGNILICGHKCKVPCRDDCPPCKEKCLFRCIHSKCNNNCGLPCVSCKEPCLWECKHLKCSKRCGEICDREPCYEACEVMLNCGHPCVGFCGEPCPPLCRICHKEELCEILFGTEDEDDARFVLLNDCNHVLESSGLENWLKIQPEDGKAREIGIKGCPKCKTAIITTIRFAKAVKQSFMEVQAVKRKIFGRNKEIQDLQDQLWKEHLPRLTSLIARSPVWVSTYRHLGEIMNELKKMYGERIFVTGKRRQNQNKLRFGINQLRLYQFMCIYLEGLLESVIEWDIHNSMLTTTQTKNLRKTLKDRLGLLERDIHKGMPTTTLTKNLHKKIKDRFGLLIFHLSCRKNKINLVEMEQFNLEYKRFKRMIEFYNILRQMSSSILSLSSVTELIASISEKLFSVKTFDCDDEIAADFKSLVETSDVFYQPVSKEEMNIIHEAMKKDFNSANKQGHWFQCSNGHIYTITECGGAMEHSVCPDCKETIGGQNHALVGTSRLAGVMDGAKHAAWSDLQNLRNFRF